jgi:hypothetical protein
MSRRSAELTQLIQRRVRKQEQENPKKQLFFDMRRELKKNFPDLLTLIRMVKHKSSWLSAPEKRKLIQLVMMNACENNEHIPQKEVLLRHLATPLNHSFFTSHSKYDTDHCLGCAEFIVQNLKVYVILFVENSLVVVVHVFMCL